jgi:hypothetical protein
MTTRVTALENYREQGISNELLMSVVSGEKSGLQISTILAI